MEIKAKEYTDTEIYWMCSKIPFARSIEVFFDNEEEAMQFAADNPGFTVEPPVKK